MINENGVIYGVDGEAIDGAIVEAMVEAAGKLNAVPDEHGVDYELVFKKFVALAVEVDMKMEATESEDQNFKFEEF